MVRLWRNAWTDFVLFLNLRCPCHFRLCGTVRFEEGRVDSGGDSVRYAGVPTSIIVHPISRGLTRSSIKRLVRLVRSFKEQHALLADDELARFIFLCDSMFGEFTSQNRGADLGATNIDWIPASGNLDTGDSGFPPPDAAISEFVDRRAAEDELSRYVGPEPDARLARALTEFIEAHGFELAGHLDRLGLAVACGTVNLYDAVCKDLVQQPGDTVLMPSISYGFFLAQPYRVGGRVEAVECHSSGRVAASVLAQHMSECNARLYEEWWPDRRYHTYIALRTARQRGLLRLPDDRRAVENIVETLVGSLDHGPVEGRKVLQERVRSLPVSGDTQLTDPRRDITHLIRPPMVRAWLHINPSVAGYVYSPDELDEVGEVLTTGGATAIEDFAYHSIRVAGKEIHTLQGRVPRCYTLFGLSKPFGLANVRIGLMLVAREDVKRIERLVENTVGFVSLAAQRTAASALSADGDNARTYLLRASEDAENGYEARLQMLLLMLRGNAGERVIEPNAVAERVTSLALGLLAAKRAAGTDVTGDATRDEDLVERFLAEGLARWFVLPFTPQAGFFVVVSCRPLLESGILQKLGMMKPCAFDVFAFLAYALGVRTIPEEGMRTAHSDTHLLRMAFSPTAKVLVESLFTIYVSLLFLEQIGHPEAFNNDAGTRNFWRNPDYYWRK